MADFNATQGAVQGVEGESRAPQNQGGSPVEGIVDAPQGDEAFHNGYGEGIPGNRARIH